MDVTNEDHVRHALDYVAENLPAGQQGKTIKLLKYTEEVSMWTLVLNYIFYLLYVCSYDQFVLDINLENSGFERF